MITRFDHALKAASGTMHRAARPSPAQDIPESELSPAERRHVAGLMRINHTGEVCAQALYSGQALTARASRVAGAMHQAAEEENDHLAWCEERIAQLDSHVSYLNPFWYAASFVTGAIGGWLGDSVSLGFVAATEEEVCHHLDTHLEGLPADDEKSREILSQMRIDEAKHQATAIESGGLRFPPMIKRLMRVTSRLMTRPTYWI
ncbi:MAG TPA: 2-polyprenyl-3-methyl-6-methoxy-1,4-benzoquinone monooxygenase [Pseudomonadales bacterium]|nr:2-polyprenyl-3-methyl-6-methoxy-1,4-benzoquinone monooxygenase [Pseudomonadales bacterium]